MKPTEGAYVQKVMNSASMRGIMDDPRWNQVILVIKQLLGSAQNQAENARNTPSFDSMIKATHFDGQVKMAKMLLHTFSQLYDRAGIVLKEAQSKLPYAPQEQRRQRDPDASRDTHKEDNDAGR